MRIDGIQLQEGSNISNLTVASGTSFPSSPSLGELFFRSDTELLYVYNGSTWVDTISNDAITLSGDASGSGTNAITVTLATVNGNVGTFGGASSVGSLTVNAKGLVTAASTVPIQIAETQVTDGALLARLAADETVTGTWSFSNPVTAATPTADDHLATKGYVDGLTTGLDIKASVRAATTVNITLSGPQTIDGVAVIAGDRVLVKSQTAGAQNGLYVAAAGAWSRAADADTSAKVTAGLFTFVAEGAVHGDQGWLLITDDPITLGSTELVFTQFNGTGGLTAGNPTAQVALTAVNGVSTSYMRADAAPALSQAISPTWTGNHDFAPASGDTVVSAGNLGVGMAPTSKLDVGGTARAAAFDTNATAGAPVNGLASPAANTLALFTNSSEHARLDASGRLLVGTTTTTSSTSQSGEVRSTGAFGFQLTNTTAGSFPLSLLNEGTSGARSLINFLEGAAGGTARANLALDATNGLAWSLGGGVRVTFTSDGNLGLGTSVPNATSESASQTVLSIRGKTSFGAGFIELINASNASAGANGAVKFVVNGVSTAEVGGSGDGANADSGLLVLRTKATGAALAERVRVDSLGNVGVGTSTFSTVFNADYTQLKVKGNNADAIGSVVVESFGTTNTSRLELFAADATAQVGLWGNTAAAMLFGTNGVERMRIDTSGRVGVNGSNAGSYFLKLTGNGSSIAGGVEFLNNGSTTFLGSTTVSSADFELVNAAAGYLRFGTSNTERVRITSGGSVGVGTTVPQARLHVNENTTAANVTAFTGGMLHLSGADSGQVAAVVDSFAVAPQFIGRRAQGTAASKSAATADTNLLLLEGYGYGATAYSAAGRVGLRMLAAETWTDSAQGSYLTLRTTPVGGTSTAEVARLTDAGHLGVGTSTPNKNAVSKAITVNGATSAIVELAQADALTGWLFGNTSRFTVEAAGAIPLTLNTNSAERARVTSTGDVLIGTTSNPSSSRLVVGHTGSNLNAVTVGDLSTPASTTGVYLRSNTQSNLEWAGGFFTFRIGGSEVARFDASGNLVIGDNAATARLSVKVNSTDTSFTDQAYPAASSGIYSVNESSTTGSFNALTLVARNGSSELQTASVIAQSVAGSTNANLIFTTGRQAAGTNAERARFDANGNMGIGTSAPLARLHVSTNASTAAGTSPPGGTLLQVTGTDATATQVVIDSFGSANTYIGRRAQGTGASPTALQANQNIARYGAIGYGATAYATVPSAVIAMLAGENWTDSAQGAYLQFQTTANGSAAAAAAERMRLDPSGNLLIGNTVSRGRTYVNTNASASTTVGTNPILWVGGGSAAASTLSEIGFTYGTASGVDPGTNVPATIGYQVSSASGFTNGALTFATRSVTTDTAPTERARITTDGSVLIGTTNPGGRLTVDSGSSALVASFNSTNASGGYTRYENSGTAIGDIGAGAQIVSGGAAGNFGVTSRSGALLLGTASTERARIDSSGNLGVLNASPSTFNQNQDRGVVIGGGAGAPGITLYSNSANQGAISFADGTTTTDQYRGALEYLHSTDVMQFRTAAAVRLYIDSSGNLLAGSNGGQTLGGLTSRFSTVHCTAIQDGTNGTQLDSSGTTLRVGAGSAWTGVSLFTGGNTRLSINSAGNVTIHDGSLTVSNSGVTANGAGTFTTSGQTTTIAAVDTGAAGANLRLSGNGGTTPNKYIRAKDGVLEWVNSGYSSVIMTLSDAGALTLPIGSLSVNGGDLSVSRSANGGTVLGVVTNSSNTASSDCAMVVQVAGTSAGDPRVQLAIPGGVNWSIAADNSDSDALVIGTGAVGAGNVLRITTGGVVQLNDGATIAGLDIGYRSIPVSSTTTTVAIGDRGKCISLAAGITVPASTFAAGDAVSLYNNTSGNLTITQGASLTLRLGGTATTGNRTLAQRGVCTIWFLSATEAIISGAGVT